MRKHSRSAFNDYANLIYRETIVKAAAPQLARNSRARNFQALPRVLTNHSRPSLTTHHGLPLPRTFNNGLGAPSAAKTHHSLPINTTLDIGLEAPPAPKPALKASAESVRPDVRGRYPILVILPQIINGVYLRGESCCVETFPDISTMIHHFATHAPMANQYYRCPVDGCTQTMRYEKRGRSCCP